MTDAERWKRVRDLCDLLEPEPLEGRAVRLERAEPDTQIRAQVLAMLRALEEEPQAARRPGAFEESPVPATIGEYAIEGKIGRGGTGTVYAATMTRGTVTRPVAIKLLHAFLDAEAERRFRREQELLLRLDHPGITRIFEGGVTSEGRPYLVMERVDGQPLDMYCQAAKLDVPGRIRLMIEVCQAVQAAHRALIAHLDLKPSNILVSSEAAVKVLDFGAAKLLDPAGMLTTARALTPMYASPEQLRGETVTTACDVYSLGLILFELLSGGWPYASRGSLVALSERASKDTTTRSLAEAASPDFAAGIGVNIANLRGQLRGDLDAITRKAMAADPARRYESAGALAADLERRLAGLPVLAQRQTPLYRLERFAARNRGAVAITVLAFIALAVAAGFAWREQRERIEADRKGAATARFLGALFASSNPMYGGRANMTVLDLVDQAAKRLDRGDLTDPGLAVSVGLAMGDLAYQNGQPAKGEAMMRAALDRARQSRDPAALEQVLIAIAQFELSAGRCPAVLAALNEAGPAADRNSITTIQYWLARAQAADACAKDPQGFVTYARKAAALARQTPDSSAETWIPAYLMKALVMNGLGLGLTRQRNFPEARQVLEEGLRYANAGPDGAAAKVALYRSLSALAYAQGDVKSAAEALGEGVKWMEGVTGPFEYQRMRIMWASRRAEAGDKQPAADLIRAALAESRKQREAIGPQFWMILVDSAFGLYRCGECADVPALLREADSITAGNMPPQWKGNRLAAEALCSKDKALAGRALDQLNAYLGPSAPLRKRLAELAGR
jgi:serine/threonine-protein kinase